MIFTFKNLDSPVQIPANWGWLLKCTTGSFCVEDRVPFRVSACYSFRVINLAFIFRSVAMEWTTPQHEEIDLNCEISSYANAEL
jgi:hypothetical protein